MEVRLLLPLFLLLVAAMFCAVNGDNMVDEILGDTQAVLPRPTTMQNITTLQCDNCPQASTNHQPTRHTSVPHTYHTTQGPSPASSPIEYILIDVSEKACVRMKAVFIVMLKTTKITNITIPSPPITEASGACFTGTIRMVLSFPEGGLFLQFTKNKNGNSFYLQFIEIRIEKEDGTYIWGYTELEALVTPLGETFTSDIIEFEVTPKISLVLMNLKVQAFEVEGDNIREGESTFIFLDWIARLYLPFRHWITTRLVPSIHTVVFLVALPLNIMAIVMFLVKMKVRKPAVVYMLNLATADLLLVSVLPFYIVYRFSGNIWTMGEGMCYFVMVAFYCNMYCSVLLMTSISVDRFLAVVYPIQSRSWRTVKRAWLVCGVIWVISLASTVPLFIGEHIWGFYTVELTMCHDIYHLVQGSVFSLIYFSTAFSLFNFLPLFISTFCYIGIIRSLSRSKFDRTHKRSRAIRLSVVVLCVFVLCFGPTNVLYLICYVTMKRRVNDPVYKAYILSSGLSSINCCLDPLIYYFSFSQCQRYVRSLLRCKKDYIPPVKQKPIRMNRVQQPEETQSDQITESSTPCFISQ